jgi:hypothetical protein
MKMTFKCADELMTALACVAISANGGCPVDENGEPTMTAEQLEMVNEYAKRKFVEICEEWEELTDEEWEIEAPPSES